MQADVSIIIRCYNEERNIGRLLWGIGQQSLTPAEIILVDSGSTDRTLSVASAYPVKVFSISPKYFSYGRSLNLGCGQAKGKYLVFASAHVFPIFHDWLEKLLAPFTDPKVGLVYGRQTGDRSTRFSEQRVFEKWFPNTSTNNQRHPFCNNANAAIRRSLWEQMPYNEELTGLEDIDWANRAIVGGSRIAYSAGAVIGHLHEETWPQVFNRYRREAIALANILPDHRLGLRATLKLLAKNLYGDCGEARRKGVLASRLGEIFAFRCMQFFGAYRGFKQRGPVSGHLMNVFYYPDKQRPGWKKRDLADSRRADPIEYPPRI